MPIEAMISTSGPTASVAFTIRMVWENDCCAPRRNIFSCCCCRAKALITRIPLKLSDLNKRCPGFGRFHDPHGLGKRLLRAAAEYFLLLLLPREGFDHPDSAEAFVH